MKSKKEMLYKLKSICQKDFYTNNALKMPEKYKNYWAGYRDALYEALELSGLKSSEYKLPWEK